MSVSRFYAVFFNLYCRQVLPLAAQCKNYLRWSLRGVEEAGGAALSVILRNGQAHAAQAVILTIDPYLQLYLLSKLSIVLFIKT